MRTFKLSRDPHFQEKLEDVVGLYLHPPEHAVVLSVDEKSQIQALERTQPGLPLKKGRCGTMTHDYKRHGTTTLFAALNVAEGSLISTCLPRHRHQEWLRFLRLIDRQIPQDKALHLIADNYATHKHPTVQRWLARHPRIHMHFTPTSSSWLNLVERVFGDLTAKQLRRGVFRSVPELIFRDFPLDSIHPYARKAAEAAHCAGDQGKFWDMHDVMFTNQGELMQDNLKGFARDMKLDVEAFNACLDGGKYAKTVEADVAAGSAAGVTGIPKFFIGKAKPDGTMAATVVYGAQPAAAFSQVIDRLLDDKTP